MLRKIILLLLPVLGMLDGIGRLQVQARTAPAPFTEIHAKVEELTRRGDIPGLTLVLLKDGKTHIRCFGYADVARKVPVTPETCFELASCSKSFTALAVLQLQKQKRIRLEDPVSRYLPFFQPVYHGKKYDISLLQLLHHTSGIPWNTISDIPEGNSPGALEETARCIAGMELDSKPGEKHHYATVNYDILGAVIEKASGLPFEVYLRENVFHPLGLHHTSVGIPKDPAAMAKGYKIGFFSPLEYEAPVYRGNYPAGYIISNGRDMARWLQIQTGSIRTPLDSLIKMTRQRDETVPPDASFLSYAMGWEVSLRGDQQVGHEGLNPNFSSSVQFTLKDTAGVVLLANSNSNYTFVMDDAILNQLQDKEVTVSDVPVNPDDRLFTGLSIGLGAVCLGILSFCIWLAVQVIRKERQAAPLTRRKVYKSGMAFLLLLPFLVAIYLLPGMISGVSWRTATVWSPLSFSVSMFLLVASLAGSYIAYLLSLVFPLKKKHSNSVPLLVALSLVSGIANVGVIYIIIHALGRPGSPALLLFYLGLALFTYVAGRKIVETKLIHIVLDVIFEIRMKLVEKMFSTSFRNFEKIDRGQVYATLNDDTSQIGTSARIIVEIITSCITVLFSFIYLGMISFWGTVLTLLTIGLLAFLYNVVSNRSIVFFEQTRSTQEVFMGLVNGLLDGFKELSLSSDRRNEYKKDIELATNNFRSKLATARIKFVDAFLIGESIIIVVLSVIAFSFPVLFPKVSNQHLVAFIMVLLYLLGPITSIMNAIPALMELKVSWKRVQKFMKALPPPLAAAPGLPGAAPVPVLPVERFSAENVLFEYEGEGEKFVVGPVNMEVNAGELLFIAGGNGSGKTTLAKLFTGLYAPSSGFFKINGVPVPGTALGEYFSTVFSDFHLFEKLYNSADYKNRDLETQEYLKLLDLDKKVNISGGAFSTIALSRGQKKRLALFQCYMENKPIYLFDEWAADQDPEFRKFFYRELLPKMKREGKIVIAISHDDQYYDMADKLMFMEYGRVREVKTVSKEEIITI